MEKEITPQICRDCGSTIVGRIDKVYCGDACRTHYNNQKKLANRTGKPDFLKSIPKIIQNNYEILTRLNTASPTRIKRSELEKQGFNFKYLTSIHTTAKGDQYRFCFDQGYLEIQDQQVLLVLQPNQVPTNT